MSQNYSYPPSFSTSTNPSVGINGAVAPADSTQIGGVDGSGDLQALKVDGSGNLEVSVASSVLPTGGATAANQVTEINLITSRLTGSLVPAAFDEVALTYVPSGNGAGQVETAIYKLASATVKTLTMSYDSSDRLSNVIAS